MNAKDIGTRAVPPARGARVDPLALWRSVPLGAISAEQVAAVRRSVAGPVLLHHRRWTAAVRGDVAAALAVALDLGRDGLADAVSDLALSPVLVAAWRGDGAARVVLARALALRRRPATASRAGLGRAAPAVPRFEAAGVGSGNGRATEPDGGAT